MRPSNLFYSFYVAVIAVVFCFAHEAIKNGFEIYSTDTFFLVFNLSFSQYSLYYLFKENNFKSINSKITIAINLLLILLSIYVLLHHTINFYTLVFTVFVIAVSLLYFYAQQLNTLFYIRPLLLAISWILITTFLPLAFENRFYQLNELFTISSFFVLMAICSADEFYLNKIGKSKFLIISIVSIIISYFILATQFNTNGLYTWAFYIIFFLNIVLCYKYFASRFWFVALDFILVLWAVLQIVGSL